MLSLLWLQHSLIVAVLQLQADNGNYAANDGTNTKIITFNPLNMGQAAVGEIMTGESAIREATTG